MKKIINLNEVKQLDINEKFIFGEFEGKPIEWTKISENSALADKILDCIMCDYENNFNNEKIVINKWCKDVLGKRLGVKNGVVAVPTVSFMREYFPLPENRKTEPTEVALMRGIITDYSQKFSPYWLMDSSVGFVEKDGKYVKGASIISVTGDIISSIKDAREIGVRPALKLD